MPQLPPTRLPRRCRTLLALIALAAALAVPAAALAVPATASNTVTSENWSGYAVHRSGVEFRNVQATWRQPAARCTRGTGTYSSFWVGIGGYSLSATALEQAGTELDCHADGSESITAWYELVPAASRTVRMTVDPGDQVTADVRVAGHRVTVAIADRTRNEYFLKTIVDRTVDASSAEWITEAPSSCSSSSQCTTLPLADFGSVRFVNATAQTSRGRIASIASAGWTATRILLGYSARRARFVADTTTAGATPSALVGGGQAFSVAYSSSSGGTAGPGGFITRRGRPSLR